jgi:hypothetical protein
MVSNHRGKKCESRYTKEGNKASSLPKNQIREEGKNKINSNQKIMNMAIITLFINVYYKC